MTREHQAAYQAECEREHREECAANRAASAEALSKVAGPASSLGLATGWVLGTLLTKQDDPYTVTTRLVVGYQFASSKDEAVGKFVAMTQERNPGYSLGEIVSLKLPTAAGQAPNTVHEPQAQQKTK